VLVQERERVISFISAEYQEWKRQFPDVVVSVDVVVDPAQCQPFTVLIVLRRDAGRTIVPIPKSWTRFAIEFLRV